MKVYNLHEITDSRVLYDKNPPRLMIYIIIIVLALITGFIVWADKSVKTYVVKGQGLVTTESKANIMSTVSGEIEEVFIEEGKEVNEGDILLTVKSVDSDLQLIQINSQIEYINERIELLTRAEEDATKYKNSFNKKDPVEAEFYNRLANGYNQRKEYTVDENILKEQGYTDEQIKQYKAQQQVKRNEMYYQTITSFTTEKNQLELQKSQYKAQKLALEESSDKYKVLAPKSGSIHLASTINKGMVLQAGTYLGTISNNNEELIIEVMLSASERPRVHNDDEVQIAVSGLNQAEYGTIDGQVMSIDEDATIDNEKGNAYFKLKIKPNKTFLEDKNGERVNLSLGMITETRVKYEKITYLKYFIEQIGIKFK